MSKLLKLDLQLFAEEAEPFGGYDPSTAYEGIPQEEPVQENTEPTNPEPEPQQPDFLDFGGRKIPKNPELEGLHKDFTEMQRYITSLQEQNNVYKQMTDAFQPQQQEPQVQQPQNWDEAGWETFYNNAPDVINQMIDQRLNQALQEQLQPIVMEREWNNQIQQMYETYPDFDNFVNDINALVQANPDKYANQGGLEEAYFRVKAEKASQMNPESLLQDQQFLQNYVFNNQEIRNTILNQYMQQKQQTNQTVPNVMGNQGGFTPQTPDSQPKTLKEASKAFLKQLGY